MPGALLLGLGLVSMRAGGRIPSWVPEGSAYFADFVNGRYWNGAVTDLETATGYARTGTAYAPDSANDFQTFTANVPRITDKGILIEPAATSTMLRSAGPNTYWNNAGSTHAALAGTFLGLFADAVTVIGAGATWNRREFTAGNLTSGTPVRVTAYYRAGTSGRARVVMRANTAATESVLTIPGLLERVGREGSRLVKDGR